MAAHLDRDPMDQLQQGIDQEIDLLRLKRQIILKQMERQAGRDVDSINPIYGKTIVSISRNDGASLGLVHAPIKQNASCDLSDSERQDNASAKEGRKGHSLSTGAHQMDNAVLVVDRTGSKHTRRDLEMSRKRLNIPGRSISGRQGNSR